MGLVDLEPYNIKFELDNFPPPHIQPTRDNLVAQVCDLVKKASTRLANTFWYQVECTQARRGPLPSELTDMILENGWDRPNFTITDSFAGPPLLKSFGFYRVSIPEQSALVLFDLPLACRRFRPGDPEAIKQIPSYMRRWSEFTHPYTKELQRHFKQACHTGDETIDLRRLNERGNHKAGCFYLWEATARDSMRDFKRPYHTQVHLKTDRPKFTGRNRWAR